MILKIDVKIYKSYLCNEYSWKMQPFFNVKSMSYLQKREIDYFNFYPLNTLRRLMVNSCLLWHFHIQDHAGSRWNSCTHIEHCSGALFSEWNSENPFLAVYNQFQWAKNLQILNEFSFLFLSISQRESSTTVCVHLTLSRYWGTFLLFSFTFCHFLVYWIDYFFVTTSTFLTNVHAFNWKCFYSYWNGRI